MYGSCITGSGINMVQTLQGPPKVLLKCRPYIAGESITLTRSSAVLLQIWHSCDCMSNMYPISM